MAFQMAGTFKGETTYRARIWPFIVRRVRSRCSSGSRLKVAVGLGVDFHRRMKSATRPARCMRGCRRRMFVGSGMPDNASH